MQECKAILAIPIPKFHGVDRRVWRLTSTGMYSVKSGYSLAVSLLPSSTFLPCSSFSPHPKFWSVVWNMKAMPKVKHFWWKVCNNACGITRESF